ncbi:MAG: hypothetical protein OK449_10750, partial [Thaumarchaeota archaeon]|nr:hypothetical protein [Nitrososphaerota archaeon]
LVSSYDQAFTVMVGLLVVAFVFALFLKGHLPKGPAKETAAPEVGPQSTEPVPATIDGPVKGA